MAWLFDLYQAQPFWSWVALAALLLTIEVVVGAGWLLWAAAAAGVTGAATLLGLNFPGALLVFALLTMVSTLAARRYFPKSEAVQGHDINDNTARLVGHRGSAVAAFDRGAGRVFIDGKEWAAELDGAAGLDAGAAVEVVGVDGARLKVRPA